VRVARGALVVARLVGGFAREGRGGAAVRLVDRRTGSVEGVVGWRRSVLVVAGWWVGSRAKGAVGGGAARDRRAWPKGARCAGSAIRR
jgi:hypothetical protein